MRVNQSAARGLVCAATLAAALTLQAAEPNAPKSLGLPTASAVTASLSLADLEQMALQNNPTLVQAATRIDASRGKAKQAGLYPNPTVGYEGDLLGRRGSPGGDFQGAFLQQEIVTAGKLRLSRAKYRQEVVQAELQAQAQQLRVVNGIHSAFYGVLAAQRSIDNHRRLLANAEEAVKLTQEMLNVGQANQPDLLQAQIEVQRAKVKLGAAGNRCQRERAHLAALIGCPELPPTTLIGQLEPEGPPLVRDAGHADGDHGWRRPRC
jgi:outer membrane protein, heavy metal efflux system